MKVKIIENEDILSEENIVDICGVCGSIMERVVQVDLKAEFADEKNQLDNLEQEGYVYYVCNFCGNQTRE